MQIRPIIASGGGSKKGKDFNIISNLTDVPNNLSNAFNQTNIRFSFIEYKGKTIIASPRYSMSSPHKPVIRRILDDFSDFDGSAFEFDIGMYDYGRDGMLVEFKGKLYYGCISSNNRISIYELNDETNTFIKFPELIFNVDRNIYLTVFNNNLYISTSAGTSTFVHLINVETKEFTKINFNLSFSISCAPLVINDIMYIFTVYDVSPSDAHVYTLNKNNQILRLHSFELGTTNNYQFQLHNIENKLRILQMNGGIRFNSYSADGMLMYTLGTGIHPNVTVYKQTERADSLYAYRDASWFKEFNFIKIEDSYLFNFTLDNNLMGVGKFDNYNFSQFREFSRSYISTVVKPNIVRKDNTIYTINSLNNSFPFRVQKVEIEIVEKEG